MRARREAPCSSLRDAWLGRQRLTGSAARRLGAGADGTALLRQEQYDHAHITNLDNFFVRLYVYFNDKGCLCSLVRAHLRRRSRSGSAPRRRAQLPCCGGGGGSRVAPLLRAQVSRVLNLATLLFTIIFSGFLLLYVDWNALTEQVRALRRLRAAAVCVLQAASPRGFVAQPACACADSAAYRAVPRPRA